MRDPNDTLTSLFSKADKVFEKNYSQAELRLLQEYKKTLKEINGIIKNVFQDKDFPTIIELRKRGRLDAIKQQIQQEIKKLTQKSVNITHSQVKGTFVNSYYQTGFVLETGTGVNFNFTTLPKESIKFAAEDNLWLDKLKEANAKLLTDAEFQLETALRTNARADIISGQALGKPYREVAKGIQEKFNTTAGRAKTITFTEMHKSHSAGRLEGINRANKAAERLGIKTEKIWRHNAVGTPRPDHVQMDGTPADENGIFTLPSGSKGEAPGLMDDVGENVNCFIGTVNVLSPSEIKKVMKRFYEGNLIEVTTAGGIQIAGTPNHPIMTEQVWVSLNSLNEGSNILSAHRGKNFSTSNPDVNDRPIIFSEIFNLFSINFASKRISGSEKDFHGDGFISNVDIISPNCFLRNTVKSEVFHPLSKSNFSFADLRQASFMCKRFLKHFALTCNSAFTNLMSFLRLFDSLRWTHSLPFQIFRLNPITAGNVIFNEDTPNDRTANIKTNSGFIFRHTRKINVNNLFGVLRVKWRVGISKFDKFRFSTLSNIVFFKKSNQSALRNMVSPGNLVLGDAGIIKVDKIVSVRRFKFSGHVYNLQTEKGYYLVNTNIDNQTDNDKYIIAHNCHCSVEYQVQGLTPDMQDESLMDKSFENWKEDL